MPDQRLSFHYTVTANGQPASANVPVQLPSPTMPAVLDQSIALPAPFDPLRLTAYLPRAALEQHVVPDGSAQAAPAIRLSIDGPKQSYQRWLIGGDMERNRLMSFIGTWRYMAVNDSAERDALYEQFKTELTRPPSIVVSAPDGRDRHELPARPGTKETFPDLGCTLRVEKFFPHFAIDGATGKSVNQSEERLNPAALVAVDWSNGSKEQWVFAKFPDFSKDKIDTIPFRITLDCPVGGEQRTPDFAVLTIGRSRHEAWTRTNGKCTSVSINVADRVDVPDAPYTFQIAAYEPAGRLIESYAASNQSGSVAALQLETAGPDGGPLTAWLEIGKERQLRTRGGPVTVHFGAAAMGTSGGHP